MSPEYKRALDKLNEAALLWADAVALRTEAIRFAETVGMSFSTIQAHLDYPLLDGEEEQL